ncbi:MAG: porin [Candidatus Obscuribacterales bacterium]|nr:porin [Candidatus Obscuribacterales bacterium]
MNRLAALFASLLFSLCALPSTAQTVVRRGLPAPLDPIFPSTEWVGSDHQLPIGVPDSGAIYPLEKTLWKNCPLLRKARIRVYGWANPGYGYSSSRHSNAPLSYAIVPRKIQLDQGVIRVERVADTVQTEHKDWGFRISSLYGIDYRYTTAQGWYPASRQLLYHNNLYGFDLVELYGTLYFPKVARGMTLKFGRYISPPDIEAQLAPDNFLWTHSQMFTVDAYTQTGILASIKLNDQWTVQGGLHAGNDMAPWNPAAIPTGQAFVRWTSKSNNDSIYAGVNSINNGQYRLAKQTLNATNFTNAMNAFYGTSLAPPKVSGHDNLQQFNITWGHRWNRKGTIVSLTEAYYLYQFNALQGGTTNNGPPHPYFALTGPGKFLPNTSPAWGVVNYTAFKLSNKDFITIRPVDFLGDCRGQRTGFPTTYSTWTLGWTHRFNDLLCIRPEIRYERALNYNQSTIVKPYDNGTRRSQFTFGLDLIQRF